MRSQSQRWLVVSILAAWMAPGAAALTVGLHVALEHHGHPGHAQDLSDVARAASHGHRHAEATPDHAHEAIVDGASPGLRLGAGVRAVFPAPCPLAAPPAGRARPERPPRWGPPASLFSAHCSLLL